ncbi:MAG: sulfite exporter TauE/SafE family protein [Candidatus Acidiferrum sp.]
MTFINAIFLFAAGAIAGAINAVAGGGSFISFPTLLFTGVAPIPANATNTLALTIGVTASGGAYWNKLSVARRVLIPLLVASAIGGVLGALLLIRTPGQTFLKVLPWLLMGATLLFAFGKHLTRRMAAGIAGAASQKALAGATVFELLVALYGGYFGGGMGILNLAMLSAIGMTDIHEMNALKVVLSAIINGTAAVTFIISRAILWPQALVMTVGAILGGYFAAHWAQKLPQAWIRSFVILVGTGMTIYFFIRAYL